MMENHPIFIDREGKSMQFALSPCDIKETIRKQIQEYGGSMVAPHKIHKGVIKLRKPGPCVSPEEVSVQYITDCITDKKLLDIKKYKFENIIVETKEEDDISLPDVKLESPLEESDSPNISQSRRKSKIRQPYTKEDDEAIIQCILKLKASKLVKGRAIWTKIEKSPPSQLKGRTWMSLRDRYLKMIIPNLKAYGLSSTNVEILKLDFKRNTSKKT